MRSNILFTFISISFFCCVARASEKTIDSITFMEPSDYQKEVLAADQPLKGGKIDLEHRAIWIIGKHNLWKWSFTSDGLEKFTLINNSKTPKDRLQALYLDQKNQTLWASSLLTLFEINLKPFKVTRHQVNSNFTATLALEKLRSGKDETLIWVKGKDIFSFNPDKKQGLKLIASLDQANLKLARLTSEQDSFLLAATSHELFSVKLSNKQSKLTAKSIYRSQPEIADVLVDQNKTNIVTKNALVLLDNKGNIGQIIPTRQDRQLLLAEQSLDKHYYLFDDGLLERFDLKQQSKKSWYLPKTHLSSKPNMLEALDALVLTLSADTVRVYFLE